jgi:hypothetical protein
MNNPPVPQPILQPIMGTENMQVAETYQIFLPDLNKMLTIERGFITDGASIPRFAWSLVGAPFDPEYVAAAVTHDALYAAQLTTRAKADDLFLDIMDFEGIGWIRRNLFYGVVRAAGYLAAWKNHTSSSIADARKYCSLSDAPNGNGETA